MTDRIRTSEVLRYLGYDGQRLTDELAARIEAAVRECETTLVPRGVWRAFPVTFDPDAAAPSCAVGGTSLVLRGSTCASFLTGASGVALMSCTLGPACDRRLRALSSTDALGQVLFDAACTELVERGTDEVQAEVVAWAHARGLQVGSRFSPGYGDFDLAVQRTFLDVLQASKRIGVTATPECLLVPTKSVTAAVGLFAGDPPTPRHGCALCDLAPFCQIRARGQRCYRPSGRIARIDDDRDGRLSR